MVVGFGQVEIEDLALGLGAPDIVKKKGNPAKKRCIARGGRWDEATQTCIMPQPTTSRGVTKEAHAESLERRRLKSDCRARGGKWNEETQTCTVPEVEPTPPRAELETPETFTDPKTGRVSGITLPSGQTFLGLTPEDVETVAAGEAARVARPEGTAPVGTAQAQQQRQLEAQQLGQQIGQFGELGISPTGLDVGEAATQGIVGSIPSAIRLGAQGFVAGGLFGGGVGAVGGPITATGGAAIGAVGGFLAGIVGGMTSNFKSQRTDTTTAQQRILDEGKQTLQDWATLARNDPVNRAQYLAEYNKQSALIDQAYRQMKLDTSKDLAKFETALPNLAEFESFYSTGGERDALDVEMRNALLAQPPEGYDLFELAERRK